MGTKTKFKFETPLSSCDLNTRGLNNNYSVVGINESVKVFRCVTIRLPYDYDQSLSFFLVRAEKERLLAV